MKDKAQDWAFSFQSVDAGALFDLAVGAVDFNGAVCRIDEPAKLGKNCSSTYHRYAGLRLLRRLLSPYLVFLLHRPRRSCDPAPLVLLDERPSRVFSLRSSLLSKWIILPGAKASGQVPCLTNHKTLLRAQLVWVKKSLDGTFLPTHQL
jgi:hypothetical protein